jgi:hypothetical protein
MHEHKIFAADIKTKDWRHTKATIFTLPGDMTCKIEHFGNAKGKLKSNFWNQSERLSQTGCCFCFLASGDRPRGSSPQETGFGGCL